MTPTTTLRYDDPAEAQRLVMDFKRIFFGPPPPVHAAILYPSREILNTVLEFMVGRALVSSSSSTRRKRSVKNPSRNWTQK